MKNYTITVNGTTYQVTVEENTGASGAPAVSAPVAAPVSAPAPKAAPAAAPKAAGKAQVVAPMPGKILSVKVKVGDSVKKGQVLLILEAMKMENEIVSPDNGTVASLEVHEGSSVEAGTVLITLN